MPSSKR